MLSLVFRDRRALVATSILFLLLAWWLAINYVIRVDDAHRQYFAAVYGIVALMGGLWGHDVSKKWGGVRSLLGRALLMFSLGLFAQEFGQIAYSFYAVYLHVEIPYPSIGDLGYFSSIIFYGYGVILLARASGAKISLKSVGSKFQAVLLPVCMLFISYYFFLANYSFHWDNPLGVFLDFGYPLGQAIYVSLALVTYLLLSKVLGGVMKNRILFVLYALCTQYVADYAFLYQVHNQIWQASSTSDLLYLFAYYVMTLALLQFDGLYRNLKSA